MMRKKAKNITHIFTITFALIATLIIGIVYFRQTTSPFLWINALSSENTDRASAASNYKLLITEDRITKLKGDVAQRRQPTYEAYQILRRECDKEWRDYPSDSWEYKTQVRPDGNAPSTFFVPFYYENSGGHAKAKVALKYDANRAYAQAWCYRMGEGNRYAENAITIINDWASSVTSIRNNEDTPLVLGYHMATMIFAADLLENHPSHSKIDSKFKDFLLNKVLPVSPIEKRSTQQCNQKENYKYKDMIYNNWSNWGVTLNMSIGAYTGNQTVFNTAISKWKRNIDNQVDELGNLPLEGNRNNCTAGAGIHYTNFAMQGLTVGAEIAYNNGINLFTHTRNGQRIYEKAFRKTAEITRYPSRLIFGNTGKTIDDSKHNIAWLEIANNYYSDDNAKYLLNYKNFRPVVTSEVVRYTTFTHGDQKPSTSTPSTGNNTLTPAPTIRPTIAATVKPTSIASQGLQTRTFGPKPSSSVSTTKPVTQNPNTQPNQSEPPISSDGYISIGWEAESTTANRHDGNVPWNVRDKDLATRWSAYGANQWLQLKLTQTRTVREVRMAVYRGDQRRQNFKIQLSMNGYDWTTVYEGNSSGKTVQLESYVFTPRNANYVLIMGDGNSENRWNSLTEVQAW